MTNTDMSKDSDSGQIITSSDILLHDAKTALLYEELRAAIDDGHESMTHADALAEIAAIRAENEKLHAELAAIGAGGVNGPLIGQPQAMPDLSALTERGAKAWTAVDVQALREGRWYMVTHDGVATLCEDLRDAEKEAKDADMAWPHSGPHRAVQLVEASTAGFTAAEDMATAGAQGFRDGVASLSANAGEPTQGAFQRALSIRTAQGWKLGGDKLPVLYTDEINGEQVCRDDVWLCTTAALAAPPTAQAEGWVSVEERMPPPFEEMIVHPRPDDYCCEAFCDTAGNWKWAEYEHNFGVHHRPCTVTHWKTNLPPTSAEGVNHG